MKKKWMTSPGRRLLAMAAGTAVLAAAVWMPSAAAPGGHEFLDVQKPCSLEVAYEDNLDFGNDLWHQARIYLDLYKVADILPSEIYDAYAYAAQPAFEGLGLPDALETANDYTVEDWKEKSQEAARIALGIADGEAQSSEALVPDYTITLQEGAFPELEAGLYLLLPRGLVDAGVLEGEEDERPIPGADYLYVDADGDGTEEKLVTCAYSKRYLYTFEPQLISLPGKDTEGEVYSSDEGEWVYNVRLNLKMSREYRYGSLQILKELSEHDTLDRDPESGWITDPATFVFEIDAVLYDQDEEGNDDPSKVLWSRKYNKAVHFNGAGADDSILIEGLPAGTHVTVTEVYSGAKYELVTDDTLEGLVDADDTIAVSFENRYDRSKKNGYGITNHFEYGHSGAEDGEGWEFTGSQGSAAEGPASEGWPEAQDGN